MNGAVGAGLVLTPPPWVSTVLANGSLPGLPGEPAGASIPPPSREGTHGQSGDATAIGNQSENLALNAQVAVVQNPGGESHASNTSTYAFVQRGEAAAESGFAGANATPTPKPAPGTTVEPTGGGGSTHGEPRATVAVPDGLLYSVDFWGMWPNRTAPLMPGQKPPKGRANPTFGGDGFRVASWPEGDEPFSPTQSNVVRVAGVQNGRITTGAGPQGLLVGAESGRPDDALPTPEMSWASVDLWGSWPDAAEPRMPDQRTPARTSGGGIVWPFADFGNLPLTAALAGLLAMFAGTASTRRGRLWLAAVALRGVTVLRLCLALVLHALHLP